MDGLTISVDWNNYAKFNDVYFLKKAIR